LLLNSADRSLSPGAVSCEKSCDGLSILHFSNVLSVGGRGLLYEVWRDRDGLKRQWESDFLKVFQGRLISENLLAAPELKFLLHSVAMDTQKIGA
jgi:hypothetical protein